MKHLSQLFSMGGYALYVWSAYGFFMLVLLGQRMSIIWQRKRKRKSVTQWLMRQDK